MGSPANPVKNLFLSWEGGGGGGGGGGGALVLRVSPYVLALHPCMCIHFINQFNPHLFEGRVWGRLPLSMDETLVTYNKTHQHKGSF